MNRKNKVFIVVGILTTLMVAAKVYLILTGENYYLSAWAESLTIHVGVAIIIGGLIHYLSGKFRDYNFLFVEAGAILMGYCSYYAQLGWFCLVHLPWIAEESEKRIFIQTIKYNEIPWLFTIITVAVFLLTYFILEKSPRLINPEVTDDLIMKKEILPEKVNIEKYDFETPLAKNLMCLKKYDYDRFDNDLSFFDAKNALNEIDTLTDTFYVVRYDEEIVGYFIARDHGVDECEITEIFGSPYIAHSFQVMNVALQMTFLLFKGKPVTLRNIGSLPKTISKIIEVIVKEYTNATYDLIGTSSKGGKTNYDIHFKG